MSSSVTMKLGIIRISDDNQLECAPGKLCSAMNVTHGLVILHLDYCNILYMWGCLKIIWKVHVAQAVAAQF